MYWKKALLESPSRKQMLRIVDYIGENEGHFEELVVFW